jgi:hypothetical protein
MLYALILFCTTSCPVDPIVLGLYDAKAGCDSVATTVNKMTVGRAVAMRATCVDVTETKSYSAPTPWNCGQYINCTQNILTPNLTTH